MAPRGRSLDASPTTGTKDVTTVFSEIFSAAVATDRHRVLLAEADAYRLARVAAPAPRARIRSRLVRLAALVQRPRTGGAVRRGGVPAAP